MILSDSNILSFGEELISPFDVSSVQPNSYDLHLEGISNMDGDIIEFPYVVQKGEFILGSTFEYVDIPQGLCAQVDGKSSLGRMGIQVHMTAGWIDTGFDGNITLEIYNVGRAFVLTKGMPIAQIVFMESYPCDKLYKGHYMHQNGVTKSWLNK